MAAVSDLSASLSSMSVYVSRWTEMLQQMNDIMDRMNGVSSSSSSSSAASATSASTTTAMTPAVLPTTAASSAGSIAAPPMLAASSAAATTTSSKSLAPTPATIPSSPRATAVVPTPHARTTASTPPTSAVAISFRLPTPPFLTAKKKIAKMARREQCVRTAVFGAVCAKREACTAAEARQACARAHAAPFASCRARASVRRLHGPHHHGCLRPRRRGSGAPRPRVRAGRGRLCRHRRGDGVLRLWVRPGRARLRRHSHEDGVLRPQALLLRRARTVVSMASCLKLPKPTAFRSPCCSRRSSSPRAGSAPGTRPSPMCGTSSWASSPSRTSSPPTTTSDGPTPSQGASSVAILGRPTILLIGTPMVLDEMSTQQEASKGGVLPITIMLQVPTISSMVMSNKNASPAFFVLEPVQPSTSLFNAIKVTMSLCTWVFSGTYGMRMLVSFGDHVVFDRGKHIESLLWPFHPISSTLSAAVPVKLLYSSPQTRMVFLQDANVTVHIPDVCAVQEQFCWYSNIPSMSLHGAVGCFLVIASKHFQSLSLPVSSIFTSAVYPSVLFWGVTVLARQLLMSIHFHSLSEDDQIVVVLFVYKDVLFSWVSGKCSMAVRGHDRLPQPKPPDRTWYAYCQLHHWGMVQKSGIHLGDSGIALSYFAVDARETRNVFESKGDVEKNPPWPSPMQCLVMDDEVHLGPIPWPTFCSSASLVHFIALSVSFVLRGSVSKCSCSKQRVILNILASEATPHIKMVFLHDAAVSVQQVGKFTNMQIVTLMGRPGVISCQLVICFRILDGCIKKHSLVLALQFSPWPSSSDCHFRLGFSVYYKTKADQLLILVPSLNKILCSVAVCGTWLATMEWCCATNVLEMLPLPWSPDQSVWSVFIYCTNKVQLNGMKQIFKCNNYIGKWKRGRELFDVFLMAQGLLLCPLRQQMNIGQGVLECQCLLSVQDKLQKRCKSASLMLQVARFAVPTKVSQSIEGINLVPWPPLKQVQLKYFVGSRIQLLPGLSMLFGGYMHNRLINEHIGFIVIFWEINSVVDHFEIWPRQHKHHYQESSLGCIIQIMPTKDKQKRVVVFTEGAGDIGDSGLRASRISSGGECHVLGRHMDRKRASKLAHSVVDRSTGIKDPNGTGDRHRRRENVNLTASSSSSFRLRPGS